MSFDPDGEQYAKALDHAHQDLAANLQKTLAAAYQSEKALRNLQDREAPDCTEDDLNQDLSEHLRLVLMHLRAAYRAVRT